MKNVLVNLNLNQNELQNAVLQPLATAPSGAKLGQLYYNSAEKLLYQYDGAKWVAVGSVLSVNGKTGTVVLTQDDVGDGSTYKRTHNDYTDSEKQLLADVGEAFPDAASKTNQLADRAFVNESINSSTAFFRGCFATKAALDAVVWQTTDPAGANFVSNNDYAYVQTDETHDSQAWRYLYKLEQGGTNNGWQAQYMINEAPLTSAQVAALNSGATAEKITQIGTNKTNIETLQSGKQDKLTFDTTPTKDSENPVTSGGVYSAVNGVIRTASGTIAADGTTATVAYSGTLIAARATVGGAEVILDVSDSGSAVTFTTAQAPGAAVTCTVVFTAPVGSAG